MKSSVFYKVVFVFLFTAGISVSMYGYNTRKYYENLLSYAEQEYAHKNYAKSLEYLIEIKNVSKDNNWYDLQIKSLNYMGFVYTNILDYNKAMTYYMEAYKIASNESYKKGELTILNSIGIQYFLENDMSKAKEYIEKSYTIAKQLNDTLNMGLFTANLATIANKIGDFDLAEKYIKIGLKIAKNNSKELFFVKTIKIEMLYLKKEYAEAESLAMEMLNQISEIQDIYMSIKDQFFLQLSKLYEQKGDFQKSVFFAKESLKNNVGLFYRIDIYEQLYRLHKGKGFLLLALQYQDSLVAVKDSLHTLTDKNRLESMQIRFDLFDTEKKLASNQAKQKTEQILFICMIAFISILALVLIWVLRIQSIKNKQRKIIAEFELREEKNQKLILEQQLKERETLALLEQERLNNEIETQNKQLIAKTLFQTSRNELIQEIILMLSKISEQSEDAQLNTIIRKLKTQLKDSAGSDVFFTHLKEINSSFTVLLKIKFPDLLVDDIRLLLYIYLYSDIKKIAQLLTISVEACQKRKERLAGKMGVKTIELHHYLLNIIKTSFLNKDIQES